MNRQAPKPDSLSASAPRHLSSALKPYDGVDAKGRLNVSHMSVSRKWQEAEGGTCTAHAKGLLSPAQSIQRQDDERKEETKIKNRSKGGQRQQAIYPARLRDTSSLLV
jgi:hypothetical protein